MAERYFSEQKFLVRTPLGDLLVWCEESSGRYDVPTIHVDYIHKDGNIPLLKTDYDYVSKKSGSVKLISGNGSTSFFKCSTIEVEFCLFNRFL